MTNEQFSINIDHISRIYESAKTGAYKCDMKPTLDGLQELRNIACEALQKRISLDMIPVTQQLPDHMADCLFVVAVEQGHDIGRILSGQYTGHPESSKPRLAYEFSSPGSLWIASHWYPMPPHTILC